MLVKVNAFPNSTRAKTSAAIVGIPHSARVLLLLNPRQTVKQFFVQRVKKQWEELLLMLVKVNAFPNSTRAKTSAAIVGIPHSARVLLLLNPRQTVKQFFVQRVKKQWEEMLLMPVKVNAFPNSTSAKTSAAIVGIPHSVRVLLLLNPQQTVKQFFVQR